MLQPGSEAAPIESLAISSEEKSFRTLQAKLALLGFELLRAESRAGYMALRWGFVANLRDLVAVRKFLDDRGGPMRRA